MYAFEISGQANKKKRLYKVGKSVNVNRRVRSYKTLDPRGNLIHQVHCSDIHFAEKLLHMILTKQGYHYEREIFLIEKDNLMSMMNSVQSLADFLCQKNLQTDNLEAALLHLRV